MSLNSTSPSKSGSPAAIAGAEPRDRLAVALDVANLSSALLLVDELGDSVSWLKVGMELYAAALSAGWQPKEAMP